MSWASSPLPVGVGFPAAPHRSPHHTHTPTGPPARDKASAGEGDAAACAWSKAELHCSPSIFSPSLPPSLTPSLPHSSPHWLLSRYYIVKLIPLPLATPPVTPTTVRRGWPERGKVWTDHRCLQRACNPHTSKREEEEGAHLTQGAGERKDTHLRGPQLPTPPLPSSPTLPPPSHLPHLTCPLL